jgi:hypothetical protein
MLFVFLAGIAPKEYIHDLLFQHTDTVHEVVKKGELVISSKHTHCSFLGFVFGPFIATQQHFLSFHQVAVYTNYVLPVHGFHFCSGKEAISLRGPPSC